MTLNALRVANFKAFGPSQRIPLRPITLLYGANSSGKSSVLHALALAHHAVETGDVDVHRTQIGGDSIDLGGFGQYVHQRQRQRQVELTFEIIPDRLTERIAEWLRAARVVAVELGIGSGYLAERISLAADHERETNQEGIVRVERFSVEVDGISMLTMSARRDGLLRLDRLNHAHPVFREIFRAIFVPGTTTLDTDHEDFTGFAEVLDELVPGIIVRRRGLFPQIEDQMAREARDEGIALAAVRQGHHREDLARAVQVFLLRVLQELVDGLSTMLEARIRRMLYLGPLRSYPPRHLGFSQRHDANWCAGGGSAWDVVRTRKDVRMRVNSWLGDAERLKTPYELQVRQLLPAGTLPTDLAPRLEVTLRDFLLRLLGESQYLSGPGHPLSEAMKAVRDAIIREPTFDAETFAAVEDLVDALVDTEAITDEWAQAVIEGRKEAIQDLVLIDKRSGTPVSHRDVGIGVSQVLPVLVAAYASKERLLAIEQPEIHLHPSLQAELGDVVIESALGEAGNECLIETHSEHLLLRIMRRIRQTAMGELPENLPPVHPDDVMVLFVEPDGDHSLVREMPLNERGELVKAWPGGFFEEGMRELF